MKLNTTPFLLSCSVQYRMVGASDVSSLELPASRLKYRLTDLQMDAEYQVRVLCATASGVLRDDAALWNTKRTLGTLVHHGSGGLA